MIQLVDADGTGLSTVANGPGLPSQPVWIPEPTEPPAPALTLVKAGTLNGAAVDYTFTITNTGNVTLHDFTVDDALLTWTDHPCGNGDLAPGLSTTCGGSHTITQTERDTGSVSNTATACANDGTTCDSDTTTVSVPQTRRADARQVRRDQRRGCRLHVHDHQHRQRHPPRLHRRRRAARLDGSPLRQR